MDRFVESLESRALFAASATIVADRAAITADRALVKSTRALYKNDVDQTRKMWQEVINADFKQMRADAGDDAATRKDHEKLKTDSDSKKAAISYYEDLRDAAVADVTAMLTRDQATLKADLKAHK